MQINNTDRSYHTGKSDTVNLTGSRNHSQTILNSVSVDLEQSHSVTPQHQTVSRSIRTVNLLHHVGNVPKTQGLLSHCQSVSGNSIHQTTGLVYLSVRSSLVVLTVDKGVLNITVYLLNLSGNLEVQFAHRVCLLLCDIDTTQSTHIALLTVRDTYGLLENLSDVRFLRTGHNISVRGSQRSTLTDCRLRAITVRGVLLSSNELYMIRGFRLATDDGRKRGTHVTLVKQHSRIIQNAKTGCKRICHCLLPPIFTLSSDSLHPALSDVYSRQLRSNRRLPALLRFS